MTPREEEAYAAFDLIRREALAEFFAIEQPAYAALQAIQDEERAKEASSTKKGTYAAH